MTRVASDGENPPARDHYTRASHHAGNRCVCRSCVYVHVWLCGRKYVFLLSPLYYKDMRLYLFLAGTIGLLEQKSFSAMQTEVVFKVQLLL